MTPLVFCFFFGQRLFDDAERLKFCTVCCEKQLQFWCFFFPSQTGSLMPLGDPQTLQTQFVNYTGLRWYIHKSVTIRQIHNLSFDFKVVIKLNYLIWTYFSALKTWLFPTICYQNALHSCSDDGSRGHIPLAGFVLCPDIYFWFFLKG